MESPHSSEREPKKNMRVRRVLGRILPFIDPVVEEIYIKPRNPRNGQPYDRAVIRTSGRISRRGDAGGYYLPTPELEPTDFTREQWEECVARGEVEPSTPNTETPVEPNSLNNLK